ncbi:MAG: DUF2752 domain-containing protein [Planctomycetes bacterium]|nr:DUF2752 domain-containing protein [Planctomycetota bacterium]
MTSSQETKKEKLHARASIVYRIVAGCIFVVIVGFFVYMFLGARGVIDLRSEFGICGFKQSYGLPCPGCGWTTSTLAFVQGRIGQSLYIQPAAAVFCLGIAISGVFALLSAAFGIRFSFLDRPFGIIVKYFVLTVIIIVAGGWAVTLARAMADSH